MTKLLPIASIALAFATTAHADDWCLHGADRSATVDAAGAARIVIVAGAGELKVSGNSAQTQVQATGKACAPNDELLGQIQIETRREGDTIQVKTLIPDHHGLSVGRNTSLDLTLAIPDGLAVELEDSSGDLELRNVKSAVVSDGSGDADIEDIHGDLKVSDSSGDLEIEHVSGNVSVTDSSGDMEIEDVAGDVEIPVDSSGDIRIERARSVHIHNDSSGEIVVRHLTGDLTIDQDSSGDITAADIGGNFTVRADGSGSIRHERVRGAVQIPTK